MSDRAEQIGERLFDFVATEMRAEMVARSAPGGLVENDGTPTPPGADIVSAMGIVYAVLMLDYHQGQPRQVMEMFGAAVMTALEDPAIRARVQFQRMPARTVS